MKKSRNIYRFLLLLLPFFFFRCYLIKQGCYIISNNNKAIKIEKVLKQDDLDPKVKETLQLVKEIKQYATLEIGLKEDKNYTSFIYADKDYLVDVVSACKKDRFESYTWWYPFFGSFPYKGFFERDDALKEAKRLKKKDLDILIREVDAFSTLGFFTDSIYSYMADYSVFSLASLIIHEQTHTTIWVKNQVQFNEELATFVGHEGALNFIKDKYGEDSKQYIDAISSIEKSMIYFDLLNSLYRDLEVLYKMDISTEKKLIIKGKIIAAFLDRFRFWYSAEYFNRKGYGYTQSIPLNNAYIIMFITYTEDLSVFYKLYENNEYDLKKTVSFLKRIKSVNKEPKEYIRKYLLDSAGK